LIRVGTAVRLLSVELRSLGGKRGPPLAEGRVRGGSLRYHRGVPIVELAGSPREIGLARVYLEAFFEKYAEGKGRREWEETTSLLVRSIPARYREEIEGLAEGAGISVPDARFLQTFLDIHKLAACSTLTARSPDGRFVVGRNLDFPSMGIAHRYGVVFVIRGEGLRPVVSVGWPGLLGAITGLNDAGLTLAVMVVYLVEDVPRGIPWALQYRRALEEDDRVGAVAARLAAEGSTNSNNLLVADGGGDAEILEIRPSGVERFPRRDGAICSTNHFLGAGRRPFTLHPQYLSSYLRRGRLERESVRRSGSPTIAELRRALRAVAPPLGNLQSMILFPEERALLLAMGGVPAARGPFVPIPASVTFG
jgi:hypothetical protein